jgi:hypothetical protein
MSLSVVINTKNSAQTLEKTLRSVDFADEIVIVDMMSTDKTLEIAKKYTDRIFEFKDTGFVEPARNFAINKAKSEWVLVIDSDEEVPDSLRQFIKSVVSVSDHSVVDVDCYYLPRKNMIFGKWVKKTGWWPDYVLRLFRAGAVEWSEIIHSVPITRGVVKELPAEERFALLHHNYSSVTEFVERLNRYTSIQARQSQTATKKELRQNQTPAMLIKAFSDELLSRLFAHRGVDEQMHGVGLSFLQALSEVVRGMKVWENQQSSHRQSNLQTIKALQSFNRDLAYWLADWQVRHSQGPRKWWWMIRRKLAL